MSHCLQHTTDCEQVLVTQESCMLNYSFNLIRLCFVLTALLKIFEDLKIVIKFTEHSHTLQRKNFRFGFSMRCHKCHLLPYFNLRYEMAGWHVISKHINVPNRKNSFDCFLVPLLGLNCFFFFFFLFSLPPCCTHAT